jgi:hypothetical protein
MKFVNSHRGAALAAVFVLSGLAACGQRYDEVRQATAADPSAVVIGTVPGPAIADPPGTTPVVSGATEMSKAQERSVMPMPGQANDHSNAATGPSQRAGTTEAVK